MYLKSSHEYKQNKMFIDSKKEREKIRKRRSQLLRDREEEKRLKLQSDIDSMKSKKKSIINHGNKISSRIRGALQWREQPK